MKFHLSYGRDGGPVACNCNVGFDHDMEDLTRVGRKRVEIDLEHFQTAFMRLTAAVRDMQPALMQLENTARELSIAIDEFIQATQQKND